MLNTVTQYSYLENNLKQIKMKHSLQQFTEQGTLSCRSFQSADLNPNKYCWSICCDLAATIKTPYQNKFYLKLSLHLEIMCSSHHFIGYHI